MNDYIKLGLFLLLFPLLMGSSMEHPFSGMIKSGTTIKPAVSTDLLEVDAIEFTEDDTDPTCGAGNYNIYADLSETVIKLCQDGAPAIIGTGGAAQWTDTGTVIHPAELTDDMSLGSATLINGAKASIDGDDDQVQFAIQGNATQTTNLIEHENSAGTVLYSLDNIGIETVFGGVEFLDDDTDPTCAAGNYNIYADLSETALKMCNNGIATILGAVAVSMIPDAAPINSGNTSAAAALQLFDLSTETTQPNDVFFRADGLKMYTVGIVDDEINEYDLSTAWNVTSASFVRVKDITTEELSPTGVFFRADGLKMYVIGSNGDEVNEYDVSTAWDISTASALQLFDVSTEESAPTGLFFRADGLKMYITGFGGREVNEYDLGTAWDVTTAVALALFDVSTQEDTPEDVWFSPDGLKFFVLGETGNDVNEYDMSTPWDVTTAVFLQATSVGAEEANPLGLFFSPGRLKMYIVGQDGQDVNEYDIAGNLEGTFNVNGSLTLVNDLAVSEGGSGASTFTDGGILLGSGTGAFTALGVAANGQIPIGDGATDPALATITGTANEIEVTNGAGSITLGLPNDVTIPGDLLVNTSNFAIEGYATGRNIIRSIHIKVQPGATPGTNINVSEVGAGTFGFNIPTITDAANLAKTGTSGSFSLNAPGTVLTLDLTEEAVGILSVSIRVHDINSSSTTETYYMSTGLSTGNLSTSIRIAGSQGATDWTTIMDAGDAVEFYLNFVTSS